MDPLTRSELNVLQEVGLGGRKWVAGMTVNAVNMTGFRTGDLSALGARESPGWVN